METTIIIVLLCTLITAFAISNDASKIIEDFLEKIYDLLNDKNRR